MGVDQMPQGASSSFVNKLSGLLVKHRIDPVAQQFIGCIHEMLADVFVPIPEKRGNVCAADVFAEINQ